MGDVPRAGAMPAGPTKDDAERRLAELERRTDELVRTWLVHVIDGLSLREVGRLRLGTAVEGFLEIYAFVIAASRAAHRRRAARIADEHYLRTGRIARESIGLESESAGIVRAISRLQELLEAELQGSADAEQDPDGDSAATAVADVCARLRAAVAEVPATTRSEPEQKTGAEGGSAA